MLKLKFKVLGPFGQSDTETFRSYLGDIVDVVGESKVSTEDEFVYEMKSYDPELLLAGVGIPKIFKSIIDVGKSLKAIVCTTMGVDFVDLGAATEKIIFVTNTPDFAVVAVAEYVVGLILAINRRIVSAHSAATTGH